MIFRKQSGSRSMPERSSSAGAHDPTHLQPANGDSRPTPLRERALHGGADDVALGLVLDALGGVLSALAHYPLELTDKPAEESAREFTAWQRHATLGYSIDESAPAPTVGVRERDWTGLVRAVTTQRREEHRLVTSSVAELRDALWACVETVHNAVQADQQTDLEAGQHMERARTALQRLEAGSIKAEVLGAVSAIAGALENRREQQQERYVSLATKLDRVGRQLEEARRETTTDALTGLGNRKLFDLMAPRAIQMFSLSRQPVALLMIDLDKLKLVNDTYGHQAGDASIVGVAGALSRVFLRQSDVLCRVGGDEFAVILSNTDWKMAQTLARRLQEHIAALPSPVPPMEFKVGASIGIAGLEPQEALDEWVRRADKALYKAKHDGRDGVCIAERRTLTLTLG
jgi:diguanylate cyclase